MSDKHQNGISYFDHLLDQCGRQNEKSHSLSTGQAVAITAVVIGVCCFIVGLLLAPVIPKVGLFQMRKFTLTFMMKFNLIPQIPVKQMPV